MKNNHKYRATIYLGKDIYTELDAMAQELAMSVSQITGIIFRTGYDLSKQLDRKEVKPNGK